VSGNNAQQGTKMTSYTNNIENARTFKTFDECLEAKLRQSQGGLVPDKDIWFVRMTQNNNGQFVIARTVCLSTGAVDYLA
jgi:hypothetical protein